MLLEVYYTDIKYDFTFETSQRKLAGNIASFYERTLFCGATLYTHNDLIIGVVYNDVYYSFFLYEHDSYIKDIREHIQKKLRSIYMTTMKILNATEWCELIEHLSKIQNSIIYRVNKELKSYA